MTQEAELVQKTTELVLALQALATVIGGPGLIILGVSVVALIVGLPIYREHLRNKRVDLIIEHKEKEIRRLAEDNRRYREVYLARMGFPADALAADAKDSAGVTAGQVEMPGRASGSEEGGE